MSHPHPSKKVIKRLVKNCLREDIGAGDLTARLTPKDSQINGKIISREQGVICGVEWVNQVFKYVGRRHKTKIDVEWQIQDGDIVEPDQTLCTFNGLAHPILSGERTCSYQSSFIRYAQDLANASRSAKVRSIMRWWG